MFNIVTIPASPKTFEINGIIDLYTAQDNSYLQEHGEYPLITEDKNVTLIFTGQNNTLSFTLKLEDDIVYQFNLDFDIIKTSTNFSDQTFWAIKSQALNPRSLLSSNVDNTIYNLKSTDLVELTNTTYVSKIAYFSNFPQTAQNKTDPNNFISTPFRIFVPSKNSNLADCKIIVNRPIPLVNDSVTTLTIEGDVNVVNLNDDPTLTGNDYQQTVLETGLPFWDWKTLISNITLTPNTNTPSAGDDIIINVTTADTSITKVYVESVVGISNKSVVTLNNGQGSFIIKTDSLSSGDEVVVKVGYKYFSNKASYSTVLL
jgi:hypothetical protein